MDEENFFWSEPLNVDAIVANDGDEFLYNADADAQGDENFYGQNQSLAGDGGWWDDNYPGQTTDTAASPTQDAYGLNILNAEQTAQLTRNINPAFINNLVDPNAPTAATATNAVNKSATAQPAYVDQTGLAFDSRTGVSYPVDKASGKQLIPADVLAVTDSAAQVRLEMLGAGAKSVATPVNPGQSNLAGPPDTFIKNAAGDWVENPKYPINISATPVNTGTGDAIAAANQQTAAAAARLNAESPNPYLVNIDRAAAEISRGQDGIARSTENIQTAQQNIANAEGYIAQNNAELANPDISAERRAVLEANNAENAQIIFESTQDITTNQTYITTAQETIQFNEASIDANSASYRATTAGSNVPVVEVNSDPSFVGPQQITAAVINPTANAAPVNAAIAGLTTATAATATAPFFGANPDGEQEAASAAQVGRQLAQQQAVLAAQKRVVNNSDWRVRLQLAPGATYLYNAPQPGILWPLRQTDGVIFPYTPKIMMNYKADYEQTPLTHSNYKGYFYKGSYTDQVSLSATFTAQDTAEAEYLLAVIHFFRSVTKMFYGQDPNRGAPPPLVYLTGLGEYQFTQHPCAVANFNYSLPGDVDYIRARSTNVNGTNLLTRRDQQSLPTNPISGAVARLQNLFSSQGINKGALFYPPPVSNLGQNQPTYVPTKIDIELTLYPMQSRQQVSRVFDNRQYNNGAQLKGGFW